MIDSNNAGNSSRIILKPIPERNFTFQQTANMFMHTNSQHVLPLLQHNRPKVNADLYYDRQYQKHIPTIVGNSFKNSNKLVSQARKQSLIVDSILQTEHHSQSESNILTQTVSAEDFQRATNQNQLSSQLLKTEPIQSDKKEIKRKQMKV